ncbi:hypothetical protein KFE25_004456 [Diacronema lutheri]|uniref:Guanylate cyclase domain-containing protein n=1 Tax=Diacronema lutheri TaxID=2081491 RepID=A0A8J6CA81_DIALT|nr:hypothetical protein KFE25_004456 [Diacronema lutheri]
MHTSATPPAAIALPPDGGAAPHSDRAIARPASAYELRTAAVLPPSPPGWSTPSRAHGAARGPHAAARASPDGALDAWAVLDTSPGAPCSPSSCASPSKRLTRAFTLQSHFAMRERTSGADAKGGYGGACSPSTPARSSTTSRSRGFASLGSPTAAASRARAAARHAHESTLAALPPAERRKARVLGALDSDAWTAWTTVVTVFVLFAPDVRLAAAPVEADVGFITLTVLAFAMFAVELGARAWARPAFRWSFFFWLDALATVSLVVDMPFVMDPLIGFFATVSSADPKNALTAASQTVAARAGRIAMLGAKAGRLARGVRLSRALAAWARRLARAHDCRLATGASSPVARARARAQTATSHTGRLLAEKLTQNTIIGCLAFLVGFSMLNRHELLESDDRRLQAIRVVEGLVAAHVHGGAAGGGSGALTPSLDLSGPISFAYERLRAFDGVVQLELPGSPVSFPSADTNYLARPYRRQEVAHVRYASSLLPGAPEIVARFDLSDDVRAAARLKSAATVVLVVLFALGAYLFSASSNTYCIEPIEAIMAMMRDFAKNPLARLGGQGDDADGDGEGGGGGGGGGAKDEAGGLKRSISKIGDLLRIGFGDAGGRIIGANLASRDGQLNTRMPGTRIHAIFGFVVVFQFALLTDCLQESIMLFVNHVAGVVHKVVHGHAGSCNKNIGEAWLVVWPLKSATDSGAVLPRGSEVEALTGGTGHTTADCAVAAFALAPLLIKGNDQIAQLSQRAELQRASPGYEISMGYGLHSGWAIEGAIGSDLKIDASYLSPNVNLASRLEAATKQYRVPLLFSSDVYDLLSPRRAALCRKVDVVTVKGSKEPMTLYTYDIALDAANVRAAAALTERWIDTQRHWKSGRSVGADESACADDDASLTYRDRVDASRVRAPLAAAHARTCGRRARARRTPPNRAAVEAIFSLRRACPPDFGATHARALAAYLLGDWRSAARLFREALALVPGDGPSTTLLTYMERRSLAPPPGWRGVRELTSK